MMNRLKGQKLYVRARVNFNSVLSVFEQGRNQSFAIDEARSC